MPWLAFVRQYWRILAITALVAGLLSLYSWRLNKAEQAGYERATAEMAARVAKTNAETAALEQRQREQSQKAAQAWETQRNDLQKQVDRLRTVSRPPIRVCKSAGPASVSGNGTTTTRSDDSTSKPIDALPAGRDIRGVMVQFGGECERYRQQLSALQAWLNGVAK